MQVTIELPDEIVEQIGDMGNVSRRLLEATVADAYRRDKLTSWQVGQILQLDYWQTDELLQRYDAKRPYTLADLEIDRQSYIRRDQR
jgi:hypothetical protein